MMVMMMAITPSLKASSLLLFNVSSSQRPSSSPKPFSPSTAAISRHSLTSCLGGGKNRRRTSGPAAAVPPQAVGLGSSKTVIAHPDEAAETLTVCAPRRREAPEADGDRPRQAGLVTLGVFTCQGH